MRRAKTRKGWAMADQTAIEQAPGDVPGPPPTVDHVSPTAEGAPDGAPSALYASASEEGFDRFRDWLRMRMCKRDVAHRAWRKVRESFFPAFRRYHWWVTRGEYYANSDLAANAMWDDTYRILGVRHRAYNHDKPFGPIKPGMPRSHHPNYNLRWMRTYPEHVPGRHPPVSSPSIVYGHSYENRVLAVEEWLEDEEMYSLTHNYTEQAQSGRGARMCLFLEWCEVEKVFHSAHPMATFKRQPDKALTRRWVHWGSYVFDYVHNATVGDEIVDLVGPRFALLSQFVGDGPRARRRWKHCAGCVISHED